MPPIECPKSEKFFGAFFNTSEANSLTDEKFEISAIVTSRF